MSVLIFLSAVLIFLLKFWPRIWNFLRIIKFSKLLEGPSTGEMLEHTRNRELLPWLRNLQTRYGSRFRIWFGKDLLVFFTDPNDIQLILSSSKFLYKSKHYKILESWLGNGLLTNGGESWHRRRKLLTPGFHFKMLGEFKKPIDDNCRIMIEKLKEKANGEAFNIYPFITLLALDIICETAMGVKENAQLQSTSEYVTAVLNMCKILHKRSFSAWLRIYCLFRLTNDFKEHQNALSLLHGETKRVIEMRRQALKSSNFENLDIDETTDDESGAKKRLAFLDILLLAQAQGSDLTDEEIREEVDTFMFEGHDTTTAALCFAVYLLSQNQAEQQKAFEEAVALEGREKETMKYLEAVIKETLRLYPSVPLYSRMVMEDVNLGGLCIPKGVSLSILAHVVQRDEKYFPEPDLFKPERFLVDESKLHPYAFLAFSAGPRNCIGQKFAMLELKCTLANILRAYELLPVEGFVPQPLLELVLKSGNGIQVKLRKR